MELSTRSFFGERKVISAKRGLDVSHCDTPPEGVFSSLVALVYPYEWISTTVCRRFINKNGVSTLLHNID